jgi:thiol-disulfide isomerase/thioredoxin
MSSRRIGVLVVLLIVAGGLAFAAIKSGSEGGSQAGGPANAPALGQFVPISPPRPAPKVAFTDLSGRPFALGDFAGKVVLVNLWATWCAPCRHEMPSLDRVQSDLGDRIAILAISEDIGGAKSVDPFMAKLGVKHIRPYLDPKSALGRAFKVDGLPTTFVIDREGLVQGRVEGEEQWDAPKMLAVLARFLPKDETVKTAFPRERP